MEGKKTQSKAFSNLIASFVLIAFELWGWFQSGKIKTATTMVALALMMVFPVRWLNVVCSILILLTTVYSGVEYFLKNRDVFQDID